MKIGTVANIGLFVCNVFLCFVSVLLIAALIQERSTDIVRVTVSDKEMLRTVGDVQLLTHKYARAYPLDGDYLHSTKWRVVVDRNSRSF